MEPPQKPGFTAPCDACGSPVGYGWGSLCLPCVQRRKVESWEQISRLLGFTGDDPIELTGAVAQVLARQR